LTGSSGCDNRGTVVAAMLERSNVVVECESIDIARINRALDLWPSAAGR
jgi:hypothetical protein